jgi:hypothetical protein
LICNLRLERIVPVSQKQSPLVPVAYPEWVFLPLSPKAIECRCCGTVYTCEFLIQVSYVINFATTHSPYLAQALA